MWKIRNVEISKYFIFKSKIKSIIKLKIKKFLLIKINQFNFLHPLCLSPIIYLKYLLLFWSQKN